MAQWPSIHLCPPPQPPPSTAVSAVLSNALCTCVVSACVYVLPAQLAGLFCTGGAAAFSGLADTALLKLHTLPQVLGVLAFVYAGHSTFPVVQQSMAKPALGPRLVLWGRLPGMQCMVLHPRSKNQLVLIAVDRMYPVIPCSAGVHSRQGNPSVFIEPCCGQAPVEYIFQVGPLLSNVSWL